MAGKPDVGALVRSTGIGDVGGRCAPGSDLPDLVLDRDDETMVLGVAEFCGRRLKRPSRCHYLRPVAKRLAFLRQWSRHGVEVGSDSARNGSEAQRRRGVLSTRRWCRPGADGMVEPSLKLPLCSMAGGDSGRPGDRRQAGVLHGAR